MKTLIFPGFSLKNKDWAYEMKKAINHKLLAEVVEWEHWISGNTHFANWSEWIEKEIPRVLRQIEDEQVNILAKSIGTLVAMNILKTKPNLINKLFICGIPLNDIEENDKLLYKALKDFPQEKIICIQNENDNHGSFTEAKKFLDSINPNIKIISKPRDDHDYPYPEEFISFFSK
ncbi:MAG: hypothetical protein A3D24_01565 [Candidatus Blackburnbacteria bacterium RIFCSPHIGHO2_02_FULL_39_13]|uniref:Alpha/beta hydrolase n=1 Tax=Candidatus Blackburnbacteria bacterium RIFCSPLOWO2_01_FULL_40_20 TaxID=1797519 RepID=A0A1G1VC49_9BACT|nr:MAG: hypothetical protein UT38_C0015G0013 [Microgenomates group bacterium GW2011_GWA2_39_19]OGY07475.1 MAG: hypothetical protein A2694_01885 [Candidatus Blackburnbacteria bacterium RIFCSPHIGHO2_01_FULL_40_17]OGY10043.1 MAG: hypothetical protein A3D24_01565 [Candidatus Blackburnbacteria bacterium RIFCSPHIGHO2_02_FULL_39_13]OGY12857.1 MAG: hypothetical protein A3A77_03120 [Candidatus Blackburnbacteria bacterium RIFCSPLOWO2_01_FULL_40_20]